MTTLANSNEIDDPARPTLILIHGATLNRRMWDAVVRHLDTRYRVIAPDLPGHGSRRHETYTLSAAVKTIVDAAQSVSHAPVVLAGDSLGGFTAMAAASALPATQLKGLVLAGCTCIFSGMMLLPYQLKIAVFKIMIALVGEKKFIDRQIPTLLGRMGLKEADVNALLEAGVTLTVFEQAVNALRGIDFCTILAAISPPVLIVNGGLDKGMIRQEASFLAAARNANYHRFENCEHGVSMLRSTEFAGLVNDFSRRVFADNVAPKYR